MEGIAALCDRYGVPPESINWFTHGTTVGVNTVIQRKGVRLCLFTTRNFVDVLEVARLKMPDPYDLHSRRPDPLVSRDHVMPVDERMCADGSVELAVDEASLECAVARARALGAEGIVVAFINAYRNPANEHAAKAMIGRLAPDLPVFCSSDVWSIIREYERTATAVIHGYVQPRVARYLDSLQHALAAAGVPAEPLVTKSNGGVMRAELGKSACVQMILSGTAAGVIGASFISRLSGFGDTMSLDVGGTSADVAFIRDGMPQYGVGELIGEFPVYIPTVAVTSIGAGGGSIAWVDDLGVLKVGPESAGSSPGPACYGRGGDRPTITDAFAVLGYIGQFEPDDSAIRIDPRKGPHRGGHRGRAHRTEHRGGGPGHRGRRRVRHVRRGEQAHFPRRHRPAGVRDAGIRRRGPDARVLPRARARHVAHRDPSHSRRAQRSRRTRRRHQERLHRHRLSRPRRERDVRHPRHLGGTGDEGTGVAVRGAGLPGRLSPRLVRRHALSGTVLRDRDRDRPGARGAGRRRRRRRGVPPAPRASLRACGTETRRCRSSTCAW